MKTVLTIAGSDCSGGAGIQADIKTITAHRMYAMSAITALTAQNTMGVTGVHDVPAPFVAEQLDRIFEDIVPDAVKVGMVSSPAIIEAICDRLTRYSPRNLVVDPVMIATSGSRLLSEDAMDALITRLLPLADLITPNIPEAEVLCGASIRSKTDMLSAAQAISARIHGAVLLKGGHFSADADDLLYTQDNALWIRGARIDNPNTHGTGCTLSSAIACELASGKSMADSVRAAKDYITGALRAGLDLGHGSGPLNHMFSL